MKQQTPRGVEHLISFRIFGATVSEVSDYDQDGLKDYQEIIKYKTNWLDADTDNGGFKDGEEVTKGTNPNDSDSHPPRAMPWLPLLLDE